MTHTEKFVCADCGWSKDQHKSVLSPEVRAKATVPKGGYLVVLVNCDQYRPSRAERNGNRSQFVNNLNSDLKF
jgi:hypothetical protein